MTIHYVVGDATQPIARPALIIHVCNDIGGWGRGFVLALSRLSKRPENHYRTSRNHALGTVQFITIDPTLCVANMIAQHGIYPDSNDTPPIRYEAMVQCLETINHFTRMNDYSIHGPRIGCGLAGGKWSVVEALLNQYLRDQNVFIYDLPEVKAAA